MSIKLTLSANQVAPDPAPAPDKERFINGKASEPIPIPQRPTKKTTHSFGLGCGGCGKPHDVYGKYLAKE